MQPIPTPQILDPDPDPDPDLDLDPDPDRVLANDRGDLTVDHEARTALLDEALRDTCAYAGQLWQDLDAMRGYLLTSLPPDPAHPGCVPPHPRPRPDPTTGTAGTTGSPPTRP